MSDMRSGKTARLLTLLLFCLVCLCLAGGRTRAAEASEAAGTAKPLETPVPEMPYEGVLRACMKAEGKRFGKAGHCYYTYTNHGKEVKVIGFRETVRKITIPEKIKGKKVTELEVKVPSFIKTPSNNLDDVNIDWSKYPSKTKCIVIPKYVRKLHSTFIWWYSDILLRKLEEYRVSPKNRHFMAKNGVLFDKKGKTLLCYPDKKKGKSYRIPKGVSEIGESAFQDASVKKVSMPDSVRSIGKYAFADSGLKKITLPKSLQSMGYSAFCCSKIEEMIIPGSLKTIPGSCFLLCTKLKKVTVRQGVQNIRHSAFSKCWQLRKVIIPPSVRDISHDAFVYHDTDFWEEDRLNVTVYAKKGSYAYKKYKEKGWRSWWETDGIKLKAKKF